MDYDDLLSEVDSVFKMISSIPVSGDAIDVFAVARSKLRNIHAELEKRKVCAEREKDSTEVRR